MDHRQFSRVLVWWNLDDLDDKITRIAREKKDAVNDKDWEWVDWKWKIDEIANASCEHWVVSKSEGNWETQKTKDSKEATYRRIHLRRSVRWRRRTGRTGSCARRHRIAWSCVHFLKLLLLLLLLNGCSQSSRVQIVELSQIGRVRSKHCSKSHRGRDSASGSRTSTGSISSSCRSWS